MNQYSEFLLKCTRDYPNDGYSVEPMMLRKIAAILDRVTEPCPVCDGRGDVCSGPCRGSGLVSKGYRRLAATLKIVDALPKCWRLVDGELVQDKPVVPGMVIFTVEYKSDIVMHVADAVFRGKIRYKKQYLAWLGAKASECADTREAAEALAKRRDGG